jgi:hypothetical protein
MPAAGIYEMSNDVQEEQVQDKQYIATLLTQIGEHKEAYEILYNRNLLLYNELIKTLDLHTGAREERPRGRIILGHHGADRAHSTHRTGSSSSARTSAGICPAVPAHAMSARKSQNQCSSSAKGLGAFRPHSGQLKSPLLAASVAASFTSLCTGCASRAPPATPAVTLCPHVPHAHRL